MSSSRSKPAQKRELGEQSSGDDQPEKRARRGEQLRSAATLTPVARVPFSGQYYQQPFVERLAQHLSFTEVLALCRSTARVHEQCQTNAFWNAWLRKHTLRSSGLRARSEDSSLDAALLSAVTDTRQLEPRVLMYVLKLVALRGLVVTLVDVRSALLNETNDFEEEVRRADPDDEERAAALRAHRSALERKWRHLFDAQIAAGVVRSFDADVTTRRDLLAAMRAHTLSEPVLRALFALPGGYGDERAQESDDDKQRRIKWLLYTATVDVVDEDNEAHRLTTMEAAVSQGNATLARALLHQFHAEHVRMARGKLRYRQEKIASYERATHRALFHYTRLGEDDDDDASDDDADDKDDEYYERFPLALADDQLEQIINEVMVVD